MYMYYNIFSSGSQIYLAGIEYVYDSSSSYIV